MDPFALLALVGAVAGGAGLWHFVFSTRARAKAALKKAPLRPIAEAPHGQLVKIKGRVSYTEEELEAPLSGRTCACFRVVIWDTLANHRTLLDTIERVDALWVEDATGRALVEMKLPDVVVAMDTRYVTTLGEERTSRQKALLDHYRIVTPGPRERPLVFREGVIEAGEEIVVFGLCQKEPDPDPPANAVRGYREAVMRVRIVEPPHGAILISDDPALLK